jgi:hypothetical protein
MENISNLAKIAFILVTILTVLLFYKATKKSSLFLIIISGWIIIQSCIGITGFYENTSSLPPRFALLIFPPLVFTCILFISKKGRFFLDSLDNKTLTILHIVRIPVEISLYYLFIAKVIPQEMTFEGRNLDIIAGITAPIIYYFGYTKNSLPKAILILWNIICVGLLMNIVVVAVLSTATALQQFGFNQPNIAIAFFPFNLLACVIVPLVLLAHSVTLRNLITK